MNENKKNWKFNQNKEKFDKRKKIRLFISIDHYKMDVEEPKVVPSAPKWVIWSKFWLINAFLLISVLINNSTILKVKLNVGGNVFMTSRETLMRDSNSMLARLVSDDSDLISDKVSCEIWDLKSASYLCF